jgi:hypothetical protein
MDGIKPDGVFWSAHENLQNVRIKRMKDLGLGPAPEGAAAVIVVDIRNTVARWQMIMLGAGLTLAAEIVAAMAFVYF